MPKFELFLVLSLSFILRTSCCGADTVIPESLSFYARHQDTTLQKQILYNGRVWRNLYYGVRGNQFLFSSDFLPGTVTMGGKYFDNIRIRYDIYKDEIMIPVSPVTVVQLNREMVDSFSIQFENKWYRFTGHNIFSRDMLKGYVNILYSGNTSLYVKYKKEIDLLAENQKFDRFSQTQHIFVMKDDKIYQVSGKKDFLKILADNKQQVRNLMKTNRLKIIKSDPSSFVPVLKFYDSLKK
jgi:hypothetical protein